MILQRKISLLFVVLNWTGQQIVLAEEFVVKTPRRKTLKIKGN